MKQNKKIAFTLAKGATHITTCGNNKKFAFTLAEVLITLGIIGVVAAMTMPSLIANYQEKQFVTAWKKVYSDVSNAALLMSQNEEDLSTEQLVGEAFAKYLKVDKVCEARKGIAQGCWKENTPIYKKDNQQLEHYANDISLMGGGAVCMTLTSGAIVCYDCGSPPPAYCQLIFDVNGVTKPNKIGTDIFGGTLSVERYQVKPAKGYHDGWGSADGEWVSCFSSQPCTGTCDADEFGFGCSAEKLAK